MRWSRQSSEPPGRDPPRGDPPAPAARPARPALARSDAPDHHSRMPSLKARTFWPLLLALVLIDCGTKRLAVEALPPETPREIVGNLLCFTLVYNPGAAMSISLGDFSRVGFGILALLAILVLARLYRRTEAHDAVQAMALALVMGGAIGNLIDRLRSARGVVDFIDVGIGDHRFWTFNVADMGVTIGALVLALVLWKRAPAEQGEDLGGGEPVA